MKTAQNNNHSSVITNNPLETLRKSSNSMAVDTFKGIGKVGSDISGGLLDALTGNYGKQESQEQFPRHQEQAPLPAFRRKEFNTLYSFRHEQEIRQIRELTEAIKREIVLFKQASDAVASEVAEIENLTINSHGEKPGIYHVRFLEIILSVLRTLRQKVNESRTWLSAMNSKKKKRGFMAMSKKKGTSFSQSNEHSVTRSVQ